MTKYEVVLVPFPFDNLSSGQVRAAVCLTEPIGMHDHLTPAFITSRMPSILLNTDLAIDWMDRDFALTGLRVSSTLQLHRLMTITKTSLGRTWRIVTSDANASPTTTPHII